MATLAPYSKFLRLYSDLYAFMVTSCLHGNPHTLQQVLCLYGDLHAFTVTFMPLR